MSLNATRLDEYRLAYDRSNLDAWEHRLSNYGALAAYQADTPNTIPGYAELVANRTHELRTVSIPVIQRSTFSTASERTCTALTHEMTSAYVTPSWTTIKVGFNMTPAEHRNNYIKYQELFNKKMTNMQRDVLAALDTLAYTNLNTNITSVIGADGNPYTAVANSLVVPAADNELLYNEIGAIMAADDYPFDQLHVISSPRNQALVREYSAQGTSNAENRMFQFGGYNFYYSNRVTVAATDRDTVYVTPPGSLAFMTDIDPDSLMGHSSSDGKEWSTVNLPLLGFDVGMLYQSTCADKSSTIGTGYEATLSESFMFSFDYTFTTAYNSATGTYASPIHKFRLTKT
jgi:hypothetical protein